MLSDLHAELAKQARRPANWLLALIASVLTLTFAYLVPYAASAGDGSQAAGPPVASRGVETMLPDQFVGNALGGTPVFVGALALIFGALVAGSEYGWQTWKTLLTQQPSRVRLFAAKIGVVGVGVLVLVVVLLGTAAASSALVASLEDRAATDWPAMPAIAVGAGGGWLITMMWGALGVLLAIVFRSVALPIGLGLVWLLAVQNLISGIAAPLLDWVETMQQGLPGPNAGSLAASLGAATDTPGVTTLVDAGQATMVVLAYLVAFIALGGWLLGRRDIL
jgi:ABC-2 type transport system permease protein